MAQVTREEHRRERQREYDAALSAARGPIAVLSLFVQGREARADGQLLEEGFAATQPAGLAEVSPLPAAVWVALRRADLDATLEALVRLSRNDFVLGVHEEVDNSYRLTTVEERRGLPDLELLSAQLAGFLQIPLDVIMIIADWGADDPRTAAEVETLLDQRFGPAVARAEVGSVEVVDAEVRDAEVRDAEVRDAEVRDAGLDDDAGLDRSARDPDAEPSEPVPPSARHADGLHMSSAEFTALLKLTPEQRTVLATLVRQTTITIRTDSRARKTG